MKEDLEVLRSIFEELAETLATQSVESATEFANEVLSEVERVSAAQVEIDQLLDKEDYQVDIKLGCQRGFKLDTHSGLWE